MPKVRPFGIIEKFEDRIYNQAGKIKDVFKQVRNNPKIEICAYDGKAR